MKKTTLITSCMIIIFNVTHAQKIKITDVSVFTGVHSSTAAPYSENDKSNLNANFSLPTFISDYNYIGYDFNYIEKYQTGILAGFTVGDKHKIRIGISGSNNNMGWRGYKNQNKSYRYDTLISSRTGQEIYVDSLHSKTLSYNHKAQSINFHADYLRTINPRNKLSAYLGAGINLGGSISNKLIANYYEYGYVTPILNNSPSFGFPNNQSKNESQIQTLSALTNFNLRTLIGINYRFSNRTPVLRNTNIFAEGNLGVDYINTKESNSKMGFSRGLNVGIRVTLQHPRGHNRNKRRI